MEGESRRDAAKRRAWEASLAEGEEDAGPWPADPRASPQEEPAAKEDEEAEEWGEEEEEEEEEEEDVGEYDERDDERYRDDRDDDHHDDGGPTEALEESVRRWKAAGPSVEGRWWEAGGRWRRAWDPAPAAVSKALPAKGLQRPPAKLGLPPGRRFWPEGKAGAAFPGVRAREGASRAGQGAATAAGQGAAGAARAAPPQAAAAPAEAPEDGEIPELEDALEPGEIREPEEPQDPGDHRMRRGCPARRGASSSARPSPWLVDTGATGDIVQGNDPSIQERWRVSADQSLDVVGNHVPITAHAHVQVPGLPAGPVGTSEAVALDAPTPNCFAPGYRIGAGHLAMTWLPPGGAALPQVGPGAQLHVLADGADPASASSWTTVQLDVVAGTPQLPPPERNPLLASAAARGLSAGVKVFESLSPDALERLRHAHEALRRDFEEVRHQVNCGALSPMAAHAEYLRLDEHRNCAVSTIRAEVEVAEGGGEESPSWMRGQESPVALRLCAQCGARSHLDAHSRCYKCQWAAWRDGAEGDGDPSFP